jgi:hypothetical protein
MEPEQLQKIIGIIFEIIDRSEKCNSGGELAKQAYRGTFCNKFPLHSSKIISFVPSAQASGVATQGGLFGTRPPGAPRKPVEAVAWRSNFYRLTPII